MYKPNKQEFIKLAKTGNLIPVRKELPVGDETPVTAFRKIEGEYSFLLESIEGEEKVARYSFIGTCPKSRVQTPKSLLDIRKTLADIRKLKTKLKVEKFIDFEEGLRRTIDWFSKHNVV